MQTFDLNDLVAESERATRDLTGIDSAAADYARVKRP